MFCNYCGKQIPDNANVCPYCGHECTPAQGYVPAQEYAPAKEHTPAQGYRSRKIDNIFSGLMYDRTPGAVLEFILWCAVCVMAVLSLLAAVLVNDKLDPLDGGFRMLWIFFMIFEIGLGVLMSFRLKAISLLYAALVFQFIMVIPYYVTNTGMIDKATDTVPGFIIALFVINLMVGVGLAVCSSIQFFSRIHLGRAAAVLSMVSAGLNSIMVFCLYFMPGWEYGSKFVHLYDYDNHKVYSYAGFWLGSIAFLGICIITALFFAFFFMGCIDSRKDKIYVASGATRIPKNSFIPGLQCIQGVYAGQNIYLQSGEMTFGSQAGVHVMIQDPYISHRHCSIRFNPATGFYEIQDFSTNGVYLSNGMRLQKGVVNPCPRGSIICMGSTGQQFRLL